MNQSQPLQPGQRVSISPAASLSHRGLIGSTGEIVEHNGDVFDNGEDWYNVRLGDGETLHFMRKELDVPQMVWIVRYVSESDVEKVGEPMPYDEALRFLRAMTPRARRNRDLLSVETGRLVSWVI